MTHAISPEIQEAQWTSTPEMPKAPGVYSAVLDSDHGCEKLSYFDGNGWGWTTGTSPSGARVKAAEWGRTLDFVLRWRLIEADPTPDTSAPAQPVSDAGWRPMSEKPTRAALCELRSEYYMYSYFDGNGFAGAWESPEQAMEYARFYELNDSEGCAERATGWRYADPAPQATASTLIRKPAHKQEPDCICASDRAGIDSFKPADLPAPTQEKAPRVSTLNRAWRWL